MEMDFAGFVLEARWNKGLISDQTNINHKHSSIDRRIQRHSFRTRKPSLNRTKFKKRKEVKSVDESNVAQKSKKQLSSIDLTVNTSRVVFVSLYQFIQRWPDIPAETLTDCIVMIPTCEAYLFPQSQMDRIETKQYFSISPKIEKDDCLQTCLNCLRQCRNLIYFTDKRKTNSPDWRYIIRQLKVTIDGNIKYDCIKQSQALKSGNYRDIVSIISLLSPDFIPIITYSDEVHHAELDKQKIRRQNSTKPESIYETVERNEYGDIEDDNGWVYFE